MTNMRPSATTASKTIGFLTRLKGETAIRYKVSTAMDKYYRLYLRGRGGKLTLSTLLIEDLPSKDLGLDNHVNLLLSSNTHYIFLRTTVIPRVPAKSLPDSENGSISRNIDAVGGEDVATSGADIEQVGLGLSIRIGGWKIMEHERRRASQRCGQDVVFPTRGESGESGMAGCGEDMRVWEGTRDGNGNCQRAGRHQTANP